MIERRGKIQKFQICVTAGRSTYKEPPALQSQREKLFASGCRFAGGGEGRAPPQRWAGLCLKNGRGSARRMDGVTCNPPAQLGQARVNAAAGSSLAWRDQGPLLLGTMAWPGSALAGGDNPLRGPGHCAESWAESWPLSRNQDTLFSFYFSLANFI